MLGSYLSIQSLRVEDPYLDVRFLAVFESRKMYVMEAYLMHLIQGLSSFLRSVLSLHQRVGALCIVDVGSPVRSGAVRSLDAPQSRFG